MVELVPKDEGQGLLVAKVIAFETTSNKWKEESLYDEQRSFGRGAVRNRGKPTRRPMYYKTFYKRIDRSYGANAIGTKQLWEYSGARRDEM